MAKTLSKSGIIDGSPIEVSHVSQSVDALTGTDAYDITISGSLTLSGGTQMVGNATTATNATTASKVDTGFTFDTELYPLMVEEGSGAQSPKLNTNLTYNNQLNTLAADGFIGDLEGNADTATSASHAVDADSAITATNATNATTADSATKVDVSTSEDEQSYLLMVENPSDAQTPRLNEGLSFNNSTQALTVPTFIGDLTGNADTATSSSHAVDADSAITASFASSTNTGSLLNNAVKSGSSENTITFTKGDASTFDVTLTAIPNSFTSSDAGIFEATPDPTDKTPAGWIDIKIDGTIYYIPLWTNA